MGTSGKAFAVLSMLAACRLGLAETHYVDPKHPQAADTNPGTAEQPWRTIGHAAGVAKAGDTVKIKSGRYREGNIQVQNSGERIRQEPRPAYSTLPRHPGAAPLCDYITFEADGAKPVVLDGSVEILPQAWKPAEGLTNVYVAALQIEAHGGQRQPILWVLLNDKLLSPKVRETGLASGDGVKRYKPVLGLPDPNDAETWYHDAAKGLLYVNLGGRNPAAAGRVEAAVFPFAFSGGHNDYLALKGLTIQRYNGRTIDFTRVIGGVIQDCLLRHCGSEAIAAGSHSVIRRNTVIDANGVGIGPGSFSKVDENLVIRNCRDLLQTRNIYVATAITYFGQDFIRLKNNVVLEGNGNGFWPDCRGNAHVHYGNSVGYCQGYGFYIEAISFQNVVMNNVVFHTGGPGIGLRGNLHNTVSENYIFGCRQPGISLMHTDLYAFMRRNQIVGNWLRDLPAGLWVGGDFAGRPTLDHFSDCNVFDPSVKAAASWGGKLHKTLAEFQQATGNERTGRAEKVNEDEMGLVSFRVAESARPWEPVLMFGNPRCSVQRFDWGDEIGWSSYFWTVGTAGGDEALRWSVLGGFAVVPDGETGGVLKYSAKIADWGGYLVSADAAEDAAIKARQTGRPDPGVLEVASSAFLPDWMKAYASSQAISERGLGYWSVSLPTAPGAVVDLRLHAQARQIAPAKPGGGLVVFAEWSDDTRRRVQREYLVGRDEAGQDHQPDRMSGTYAFGPIEGAVTVPDWARRFRMFFGLRSCSGVVLFDDIDTIRTRAGTATAAVEPVVAEAQPQPLADPATLAFHIVDLSKVVNRALGDEKADDGMGGWTDQGAGADMSGLAPGRKEYQGVPFEILKGPRSVVVLASPNRPQSQLPKTVSIDVQQKADVLYFLHDCAWTAENVEHFRYVVRYDDGATAEIPVIGGLHVCDWAAGYRARFTRKTPNLRPSVAATLGGGMVFPEVNLYMLEWLNPRPDRKIIALDFVGGNAGVPILLGITAGTKK